MSCLLDSNKQLINEVIENILTITCNAAIHLKHVNDHERL